MSSSTQVNVDEHDVDECWACGTALVPGTEYVDSSGGVLLLLCDATCEGEGPSADAALQREVLAAAAAGLLDVDCYGCGTALQGRRYSHTEAECMRANAERRAAR